MSASANQSAELLAPPNRGWMGVSLIVALIFDLVPRVWGAVAPEITMMTLTFWALRAPQWCGMSVALGAGFLLDVGRGMVLGQSALAFVWVVWGAQRWRTRVLWFSGWGQAAHLVWLWGAALALETAARAVFAGGSWPPLHFWVTPLVMMGVWPFWQWVLLWPQRYSRAERG
ncbi:MAG: rod shape-determining protein MreD [Hydrogenophilus sp.]|nr:rod shape-determining protein MreD [Hydrogenophilus sp.]